MFEQYWLQKSADVDQLFFGVFDMRFISSMRALWADYSLLLRHLGCLPLPLFAFCFLKPLSNVKWVQRKETRTKIKNTKRINIIHVFLWSEFPSMTGCHCSATMKPFRQTELVLFSINFHDLTAGRVMLLRVTVQDIGTEVKNKTNLLT